MPDIERKFFITGTWEGRSNDMDTPPIEVISTNRLEALLKHFRGITVWAEEEWRDAEIKLAALKKQPPPHSY